jgi:hypothetical protein
MSGNVATIAQVYTALTILLNVLGAMVKPTSTAGKVVHSALAMLPDLVKLFQTLGKSGGTAVGMVLCFVLGGSSVAACSAAQRAKEGAILSGALTGADVACMVASYVPGSAHPTITTACGIAQSALSDAEAILSAIDASSAKPVSPPVDAGARLGLWILPALPPRLLLSLTDLPTCSESTSQERSYFSASAWRNTRRTAETTGKTDTGSLYTTGAPSSGASQQRPKSNASTLEI